MTTVRPIEPRDEAQWHELWQAYLDFYQKTDLPNGHAGRLFQSLVTGEPWFAFVAERDGELIGFVHGLPHPSTWSATGARSSPPSMTKPDGAASAASTGTRRKATKPRANSMTRLQP